MNPLLGRWVSADPLAVHSPGEADLNLYAYVHGTVLKSVDPMGLADSDTVNVEAVDELNGVEPSGYRAAVAKNQGPDGKCYIARTDAEAAWRSTRFDAILQPAGGTIAPPREESQPTNWRFDGTTFSFQIPIVGGVAGETGDITGPDGTRSYLDFKASEKWFHYQNTFVFKFELGTVTRPMPEPTTGVVPYLETEASGIPLKLGRVSTGGEVSGRNTDDGTPEGRWEGTVNGGLSIVGASGTLRHEREGLVMEFSPSWGVGPVSGTSGWSTDDLKWRPDYKGMNFGAGMKLGGQPMVGHEVTEDPE